VLVNRPKLEVYLIQHVNISVIVLAGGIKLSEFKVLSFLSIRPLSIYRLLVPSRTLLCSLESNRLPTKRCREMYIVLSFYMKYNHCSTDV